MQESLQKLQDLLQQLFHANTADLDFGIYRIINFRRDQIQNFINEELSAIIDGIRDFLTKHTKQLTINPNYGILFSTVLRKGVRTWQLLRSLNMDK